MKKYNKYRFYIIGTGNDYIKYMWKDAVEKENVIFLDTPIYEKFPLKKMFDAVEQKQYSFKLNLFWHIPGKKLWRKYYTINDVEFDTDFKNIIVFSDVMRVQTDFIFWKRLKIKYNLTYCLILLNSCEHDFNANSNTVKKIINSLNMDKIFTFDNHDASKYKLHYFPSLYSGLIPSKAKKEYDFYFVGKKKNRYDYIMDTFFALKKSGYKCLFRITDVEENEMIKDDGIIYNKYIPYDKVVEELSKSYGIVDIKIPEQSGLSLRYFEALQYNKALLTNNPSVKKTPYYKKNHMYYFENTEEIQTLLQGKIDIVNYDYDGRYSPVRLLSMLQSYLEGNQV